MLFLKMYLTQIFMIFVLINYVNTKSVEVFYEYVSSTIKNTQTYQLPINNEKLFSTCDATVHDCGLYDFIIVGGGSAGVVLANRLSEISEWKILLIEAGGKLTNFSKIPGLNHYLQYTDMNWGYFTSPQSTCCQGMENNQCVYPRGKVIGGTSVINGAVYARGSPSDYNEWVKLGNPGWSYEEVLPYFKKSERVAFKSYDEDYHGTSGLLFVNKTSPPSIVANSFLNANVEKGLREVDYNGKIQIGVSKIQFNIKDHYHHNGAHAFLDPIRKDRKNLKIVLNAGVNQLLFEQNNKVEGVSFIKGTRIYRARAKREVILSAGSINTPQLLLLSGIGPKDELENLNIPVRHHLPAVGKHLQDHPLFVNLYFRTNISAPNETFKKIIKKYRQGLAPLTNGATLEQIVFLNVDNITHSDANIEFITFVPPYSVPDNPHVTFNFRDKFDEVYKRYNTMTDFSVLIVLLQPKSRGTVTLKSNSILDFPLININYFSDPNNEDLETMYKGIKYVLSLSETKSFKEINARYIGQQPGCEHLKDDREYWYCALRHMTSTEYHPACTTKMGSSIFDSVVDTNCLVHDFKNLRIVDAGVLPLITRGHLNAAVYMIAEKISDVIKKTYNKL